MVPQQNATVLITTRNRSSDLRRAVASACAQTPAVEVIVIDDGSTDDTSEVIRRDYPAVRLVRFEQSAGYIVRRNEGVRLAETDYVFVIDDDAEFSSPLTVKQGLTNFERETGAVAIPFVNVTVRPDVEQSPPTDDACWVSHAYIGTAHALRRQVFLDLGGYRTVLVHQGEEEDYCIRMLAHGYHVRLGTAAPILHYLTPNQRSFERVGFYGPRNLVLFAWHNVPWPFFPVHLTGTCINSLRHGARTGYFGCSLRGVAAGFAAIARGRCDRRPVSTKVYREFRRLKKSGPSRASLRLNKTPSTPLG